MNQNNSQYSHLDLNLLAEEIKTWGRELGFQQIAITDTDLSEHEPKLKAWLEKGYHGSMEYMAAHGTKRSRPAELIPGTTRIILGRMDYLPPDCNPTESKTIRTNPNFGIIARYARGRDYHRLIRKRLKELAKRIEAKIGHFNYRPFADSAPVMEKPLAEKAGLGWIGKHTILINREAGSWFFLGALFTELPLPLDAPVKNHCGTCSACIDICPTQAIVGPKQLDARRCISYLTIENKGPIPLEFRKKIGNRIFGCDDCQLICPWNRYAKKTEEKSFFTRIGLESPTLIELFALTETQYLKLSEGSALRRIGFEGWLRNIAVALGNAPYDIKIVEILKSKLNFPSVLVQEHILWALKEQDLQSSNLKNSSR